MTHSDALPDTPCPPSPETHPPAHPVRRWTATELAVVRVYVASDPLTPADRALREAYRAERVLRGAPPLMQNGSQEGEAVDASGHALDDPAFKAWVRQNLKGSF